MNYKASLRCKVWILDLASSDLIWDSTPVLHFFPTTLVFLFLETHQLCFCQWLYLRRFPQVSSTRLLLIWRAKGHLFGQDFLSWPYPGPEALLHSIALFYFPHTLGAIRNVLFCLFVYMFTVCLLSLESKFHEDKCLGIFTTIFSSNKNTLNTQ